MPEKKPLLPRPLHPKPSLNGLGSRLPETVQERLLRLRKAGRKAFAVLLDPDNYTEEACAEVLALSATFPVDFFFVGGSLIVHQQQARLIAQLKAASDVPVVLFPSSSLHLDPQADALLFLSLISGRNAELLIGQHVTAAPIVKASKLEVLPTGYLLIDTGRQTTASYMSGTTPLPNDKPAIAACTAMAGELLGLRFMYLDGGSGAAHTVHTGIISAVRQAVDVPLIVGGGISTGEKAEAVLRAGADVVVVGNEIETNPGFLAEMSMLVSRLNS